MSAYAQEIEQFLARGGKIQKLAPQEVRSNPFIREKKERLVQEALVPDSLAWRDVYIRVDLAVNVRLVSTRRYHDRFDYLL